MRPARVTVSAALALLALGACATGTQPERDADGAIVAAADDVDVFALRVGDCLDSADLEDIVTTVPTRPCAEPHDTEVYAAKVMVGDTYPGEDKVVQTAEFFCFDEFAAFVGTPYQSSELDFFTFYPTEDSWWHLDDREILCLLVDDVTAGGVTGTLAGSGR